MEDDFLVHQVSTQEFTKLTNMCTKNPSKSTLISYFVFRKAGFEVGKATLIKRKPKPSQTTSNPIKSTQNAKKIQNKTKKKNVKRNENR